jgi:hypothetical protein
MPNVFKFNTSTDEKSLRKGNFSIGVGDVAKGPTTQTGFYNGITPPEGGWTLYHRRGDTNNFGIYTASTDNLVSLTNQLDGKTFTQVWQCLNHFAGTSSRVILNKDFSPIVTDGLIWIVDASNTLSYPATGSTWYDISGNSKNGALQNSPLFSTESGGGIVFDGINDVVNFGTGNTFFPLSQFTIDIWFKSGGTVSVTGTNPGLFGFTYGLRAMLYSTYLYFQSIGSPQAGNVTTLNTTGNIPFLSGKWFNVVMYHSGTSAGIYVNGVLNVTTNSGWNGTSDWPTNTWNLGRDNNNSNYFFKGEIPICRMYNRVLTVTEVSQNFYQSQIVTDGLVYALDPGNLVSYDTIGLTAYSLIGNFTASLVNGTTFSKNFGGVFDFDGNSDFIELPYDSYWNSNVFGTSTNFTLECWYKPDVFENWDTIIEKAQTSGFYSASEGPAIWSYGSQNPSNPGFVAVFSSGTQSNPGGSIVQIFYNTSELKWYHLCFTGDGTTLRFYVDGVKRGTALVSSRTIPVTNGNAGPRFGRRQYMDGQLASARFYTRHLTSSEVSNNYGATKWRFGL